MKLVIDTRMCTGHGRCYSLVPELFDADDEGHSVLKSDVVPDSLRDRALVGVQNCPERAISILD